MLDVKKEIKFSADLTNLFSDTASRAAEKIRVYYDEKNYSMKLKDKNKSSQIRKFYDELVMWNDRVQSVQDKKERQIKYEELVPFIKMLKAKVAYAEGRKHIDSDFSEIFNQCIDEINSPQTLRLAKLFMESVMGFCKYNEEIYKKTN